MKKKVETRHKSLMRRNLKSQGISINIIIIASIALIILVVLVAVFTGRFGVFTSGVKKATTCSEACKAADFSGTGEILEGYYSDSDSSQPCIC